MRTSEAIQAFGGSRLAVAQALGITYSAVSQWGEIVPPHSAIRLAMIRPDLRYDPEQYRDWNSKFGRKSKKAKPNRH